MMPRRIQIALIAALVLGAIGGVLLSETAAGYWVVTVIATIGGVFGGAEEAGPRDGALRGLAAGFVYGVGIVLANAIVGDPRKVDTSDPFVLLIVVTAIAGAVLGVLGGLIAARRGRSAAV